MERLRNLEDDIVQSYLALLEPGTTFYEVRGEGPFFTTRAKHRTADPLVMVPRRSRPRPLSGLSRAYAGRLGLAGNSAKREYRLWSDRIEPRLHDLLNRWY